MKKSLLYIALAAFVLVGCAKTGTTGLNDASKRYFDAWLKTHHPSAVPTALGAYVIDETPGSGVLLGDCGEDVTFLRLNYIISGLDGTISKSNMESVNKQLGSYSETKYYGPVIWERMEGGLYAGVDEALSTMRVGGSKTTVIPGWLQTYDRYNTAEDYVKNVSGSDAIYNLQVLELIDDISKWETDSITRYLLANCPGVSPKDSLKYGFYYIRTKEPANEKVFPHDTTIYINYTGRLLDGRVFDTTIKDTAKCYGLYSSSKTYSPVLINWYGEDEDYSKITMTSNETKVVDGFSYAISQMHEFEAGRAIFYSGLGYASSGSGSSIPSYSPLIFDIEIVEK